ncbi:MAG: EscU/YscU/HrcU family type III secretion system export apparatus switch protein [Thiobacillus sp.]
MAEETDLSRTEPASPRRLQQARAAGDVPRSTELTVWVVLLSAFAALGWLAPRLLQGLGELVQVSLRHAGQPDRDPLVMAQALELLLLLLPLLAVVFIAALVAPMLLSGWVFAPQFMQADIRRLNPLAALARLFSYEAWFDVLKTLLKLTLVAAAVWWAFSSGWTALLELPTGGVESAAIAASAWVGRGVLAVMGALAIVAVLDGGWRWWRYLRRHAMTWQEVLAEAREAEGSPEMRARMRQRQQQGGAKPGVQASTLPDGTSSHSTKPASGQVAAYPQPSPSIGLGSALSPSPAGGRGRGEGIGEGANVRPKSINEVIG